MDFEGVKSWLAGQARKRAEVCGFKAVVGFALAPIALWFAATCIYWELRTILSQHGNPQPAELNMCFWITMAAIPLMFVCNRLVPRRDMMDEVMDDDAVSRIEVRYGLYGRMLVLMHLVLWVLFTGPRLVDWAVASVREGRQWRAYDIHSCAAVLSLLASRLHKVPYEEIQREIPWLNMDEAGPELMRIPGVLKLKSPPAGLGLTDDLRKAISTGGSLEF